MIMVLFRSNAHQTLENYLESALLSRGKIIYTTSTFPCVWLLKTEKVEPVDFLIC